MSKKTSTIQALAQLKGPEAANKELNKIKEIKNRRQSNMQLTMAGGVEP